MARWVSAEDVITITENDAEGLTKWSGTPDEPAAV